MLFVTAEINKFINNVTVKKGLQNLKMKFEKKKCFNLHGEPDISKSKHHG